MTETAAPREGAPTAASFYNTNPNYVMGRALMLGVDITTNDAMLQTQEKLLDQCGGFILSDTCCPRCLVGQHWYDAHEAALGEA